MNYDKFYARSGYESLILQQPHIEFGGLWEAPSGQYFIVCPSLDSSPITSGKERLDDWFDNKCRVVGSPVSLIKKTPDGCTRVAERTAIELSLLHGEPLTISEVSREISNSLPPQFPLFQMTSPQGKLIIEVYRELSSKEISELEITLSNFKVGMDYVLKIKPKNTPPEVDHSKAFDPFIGVDNIALLPSRIISSALPSEVQKSYVEDEEFWVDHRVPLLSSNELRRENVLPKSFTEKTSSCLIDATTCDTNNLRTYLPIYHRIIITMPLKENLSKMLFGFGVSRRDLLELVSRGRVQFIMPQPIQRYDVKFVADVLNANASSAIFSRKLSAASVIETRSRIPFLYPAVGTNERRAILEVFSSINDSEVTGIAKSIGDNLGLAWVGMERNLSARGAMGNMSHGVGPLFGQILTQLTGKDLILELSMSAMLVEWAAALNSTYFPYEGNGYSSYGAASVCASMYSGVRNAPIINPAKDFKHFVNGVLTLDNDAPVLEIDSVFSPRDIDQLANLLSHTRDIESRQGLINKTNERIQQYEKNADRLNRLDISSLGGAAAGALTGNIYLPLGIWITQYILSKADPSIDFGGRALDWVRGANAFTSADVVLLSRIRNKLTCKA